MDVPINNLSGSQHAGPHNQPRREAHELFKQPVRNVVENISDEKYVSKIFDIIINISLVAIFFGIPVFFTGFTSQGIGFEKQMYFYFWILIALIAWTSNGVIRGEMKIRRTPLDIPILIFWFVFLLSTIFSVDKWHSFWGFFGDPTHGFINVTASVIVYYIILSHFNEKRLRLMLGAFLASGFVVMIWELLVVRGVLKLQDQNFLQAHSWAQHLPNSPIGSISGTSVFLSILVILLVTAFLKTKLSRMAKTKRTILMAVFLVMIAMALYLLLTFYFFVPWPGILIGAGFFLIYILARIVKTDSGSTWLPMVVFMIVLAILLVGNILVTSPGIKPVNFPAEINPQYQLSWQVAKEAVKQHFFLGSGPATYGYIFSSYKPQDFNDNNLYNLRFYQGSGILWEALPTLGALGTFALILLIISFLSVGIYLLSKDKEKNKIYSLGLISSMLVILVSAFLIRIDGTLVILSVLLGTLALGVNLHEGDAKEEHLNLSLKTSPKYALALAFVFLVVSASVVFLFVFLGRVYASDIFVGLAGRQKNITEEKSAGPIVKAINLYSKEGRYYTIGGQQYMVLANAEFLKGDKADTNLIGQYLDNSITLASKGRDLMPKDVVAVEALAQAYENKAAYFAQFLDQAIATYNDALALEPHSPDIYLKLGQLKAKQGSMEKDEVKKKELFAAATDMFQKSIDEKKDYAQGYYYLSLMQDQAGDIDKAIESAKKVAEINPQDINGIFNLATLYQKKGGDDELKTAEYLYQQILNVAPNDVNTHLNLGLLYEKQKKKDQAIEQYQKTLDVLPTDSEKARSQVQVFIDNVKKGISNDPRVAASAPIVNPNEGVITEQPVSAESVQPVSEVPAANGQPTSENPTIINPVPTPEVPQQ